MSPSPFSSTPRSDTLAWFAKQVYQQGTPEDQATFVEAFLERRLPSENFRDFVVLSPNEGDQADRAAMRRARRIEKEKKAEEDLVDRARRERVDYRSFNPPDLWGAPLAVFEIEVRSEANGLLMHHTGEEIVRPRFGRLNFDFLWTPGKADPAVVSEDSIEPGQLLRLNPHIPHRVWTNDEPATAWLIAREASNVPAAIAIGESRKTTRASQWDPKMRMLRASEVRSYADYAMHAWGLVDYVRQNRSGAELSSADLASLCGVTPSHMSRIEHGHTNVTLDTLLRVVSLLRIRLPALIRQASWKTVVEPAEGSGEARELVRPPGGLPHHLHPFTVHLSQGSTGTLGIPPQDRYDFITVIGHRGDTLLTISDGSGEPAKEILQEGGVAHFRRPSLHTSTAPKPVHLPRFQVLSDGGADLTVVGCSII